MTDGAVARVARADGERFHGAAIDLAGEARRMVRVALDRRFRVETKTDASLVTDVDRAVEGRLRELIGRCFPDHGVVGKEYPPTAPESPFQWILHPLDGTEEFVHGIPTFGTMLALHHRGRPLVGAIDHAALDLRVTAGVGLGAYRNGCPVRRDGRAVSARPEGVRLVLSARLIFTRHVDEGRLFEGLTRVYPTHRIYRAAYAHTAVVTGAVDAMVDMHNEIWDLAPAQVLIEGARACYEVVRDFAAADGGHILSAVFGRPAVVDRVVTLFRKRGPTPR